MGITSLTINILSSSLQLGTGGQGLNPFRAIHPDFAIVLGTLLLSIFPGLWFVHTLRIMIGNINEDNDVVSTISVKEETLLVILMIVMTVAGYRQFPVMQSILTALAVSVTVLLPLSVGLLTIRYISTGKV